MHAVDIDNTALAKRLSDRVNFCLWAIGLEDVVVSFCTENIFIRLTATLPDGTYRSWDFVGDTSVLGATKGENCNFINRMTLKIAAWARTGTDYDSLEEFGLG